MLYRQLTDSVVRLSGWLLYRVCTIWQDLFEIISNFYIDYLGSVH